jgi:hypothetical protein
VKARDVATPIVLLVLAAATIVYAYFFDTHATSDGNRADSPSDVFPNFRVDEVTRVELVHSNESLVLERSESGRVDTWILRSPTVARANSAAVDVLLRELDLATIVRSVRESDAAGLDAPRVLGRVTAGRLEHRFALGADALRPEGAAYFRLDGKGTFVVNRSLKVQLLRGADAYRDRTLAPIAVGDVERIEVHEPGAPGVILEHANAEYRIAGSGLRASRNAVDRLLLALTEARVEAFTPVGGAADPMTTFIALEPRDRKRARIELRIGGKCPVRPNGILVARIAPEPMAGCASDALLQAVEAGALSDASVFFAHADEIEELRLEALAAPGRAIEIARKDRGWRERSPADRDLSADESASANELAVALAAATALDVKRAPVGEAFEPQIRATVVDTGGGKIEIVELSGPRADGTMRARRLDDGAWLTLALATARRFVPHSAALRGLSAWHEPLRTSSIVAIDDRCGPEPQRLERASGTWSMRAPRGMTAGMTIVEDLLDALARAQVESWDAEHDDGTFGLTGPQACTVVLSIDDGNTSIRRTSLVLGADAPQGVYARTGDDPAVFVIRRSLKEAVLGPLIDTGALRIDPDVAASIRVTHRGERTVFERAGDRFVAHGANFEGGDASNSAADTFERDIAALRPIAAIHFGAASHDEGFGAPALEIEVTPRSDAGPGAQARTTFGAKARYHDADVYFARAAAVDATFVVPATEVDAVLDLLRTIQDPARIDERESEPQN